MSTGLRKRFDAAAGAAGAWLGERAAYAWFFCKLPFMSAAAAVRTMREVRRLRKDCQRATVNAEGLICDRGGRPIRVQLRPATAWTCEVCARVHFFEPERRPMTREFAERIARAEGMIDDWQGYGDVPEGLKQAGVVVMPSVVRCPVCEANMAIECPCGHGRDDGGCCEEGGCDGGQE